VPVSRGYISLYFSNLTRILKKGEFIKARFLGDRYYSSNAKRFIIEEAFFNRYKNASWFAFITA